MDFNTTATKSPYSLTTSELGVHSIQVLYTSHHFPNEQAMPVNVTVEGEGKGYHIGCYYYCTAYNDIISTGLGITTSSLTATSVNISWILPMLLLPAVHYTLSLTRVTGSGQELCTGVIDSRPAVTTTDTSMPFTGLEEFSTYTVTVNTTFNVSGSNMDVVSNRMFTTSSAGMDTSLFNMQQCSYLSSM